MSFDVAVWSHAPRTTKDAQGIYKRLCASDTSGLQPRPTAGADIRAFLAELTARYPTDDLPDNHTDEWVWSAPFDISDASVILTMPFSRVNEILPFVVTMAEKNNLTIYLPQSNAVRLPPKSRATRRISNDADAR